MATRKKDLEIITTMEQDTEATDLVVNAHVLAAKVDNYLEIKDEPTAEKANELLKHLKKTKKEVDEKRKALTAGARKTVENINEEFKPYITELDDQIKRLTPALTRYLREKEEAERKAREEKERKAREKAEAERREVEAHYQKELEGLEAKLKKTKAGTKRNNEIKDEINAIRAKLGMAMRHFEEKTEAEPEPSAPARVGGVHGAKSTVRIDYDYELMDISKVPEEYLKPPEERLARSALRAAAREQKEIPGLKLVGKPTLMTR